MAMDMDEGRIRMLDNEALKPDENLKKLYTELKPRERLFRVGDEFEVNECLFEIIAIIPDPENILVLKGKAKTKL